MHHAMADTEDPTTQIAWPSRTMNESSTNAPSGNSQESPPAQEGAKKNKKQLATKRRLSTWNLITLSISMAGAQIAWTVELGYGTPFLLTLGISEQVTSLVWLAGPISGLIAQPVIGAISDSSTSKWRRRSWIIGSTVVLVLVTLVLAYCEALAAFFVDLVGVGAGDWDERRNKQVVNVAIGLAVTSFYLLDFALNALQASLRNLLLDITPAAQLNSGNAWHGRMTHAGNIIGFGFGFLPLAEFPLLKIFGGSQFRKFCILCNLILVITVGITCFCHTEEERPAARKESKFREVLDNIYTAIVNLPRPIRRVCYVQLFAFMGWFPFLFYSTTYVAQIMAREIGGEPDSDFATRKGELAMLFYSIVGVISGTILPHLASRDRRLMAHKEDVDEDAEVTRIRHTVREWRAEAARKGKPLRLPVMPFLLRNIWTGAMLWFSFLTFMTFFVDTVLEASLFVALVGISWAVAMWAPFAIIMELLKEISNPTTVVRPTHTRTLSTPPTRVGEQQPLLTRRRSYDEFENGPDDMPSATPVAGGTILGVHNLAIVMPQFIVSLAASIIFRVVDKTIDDDPANEHVYFGKNGVAWVLRFGGLCTLFGALLARRVPPTPTEKAMRRRLGEMRLLQSGNTP